MLSFLIMLAFAALPSFCAGMWVRAKLQRFL